MAENENQTPLENEQTDKHSIEIPGTQEEIKVDPIVVKTLETRIEGVKEATQRSRFIFIIITIISSAIIITLWNSTLSWDSWMAGLPKESPKSPSMQRIEFNKDEIIKEWVKNQVISVGLLGIRISGTDLAVVGSGSLIVAMTWFFFSIRRENRAIVTLLQDVNKICEEKQINPELCRMVYYGIVQSIVFIDMGGGDEPEGGIELSNVTSEYLEKYRSTHPSKKLRSRIVLRYIFFLPPLAIALVVLSDIYSLFIPSPIRNCQDILIACLWNEPEGYLYVIKIILFEAVAFWAIYYIWSICRVCREFSRINGDTIEEFGIKYGFYRKERE
jgi:hypothetical protein